MLNCFTVGVGSAVILSNEGLKPGWLPGGAEQWQAGKEGTEEVLGVKLLSTFITIHPSPHLLRNGLASFLLLCQTNLN